MITANYSLLTFSDLNLKRCSRLFLLPALLRPAIGGVAASAWKLCGGVVSETAAPRWCQRVSTGVFLGDITNYGSTPPFGGRAGRGGPVTFSSI